MKTSIKYAFAAALVAHTPLHAASFVNGSFENGTDPGASYSTLDSGSTDITGWKVSDGSVDYIGGYWSAQDGSRSVDLAGLSSPSSISQSFDTTPGASYLVSFWMAGNQDGPPLPIKAAAVSAGSYFGTFTVDTTGTNHSNMGWQQRSFVFVANAASTLLSFGSTAPGGVYGQGGNGECCWGAAIDNVSVTPVPEPHEWAMMLAGLGIVGTIAARRRAQPSA